MKSKVRTGGFSLTELLVVIFIIALLMVLGIPALNSLINADNLATSSNQITSLLELGRQDAISLNANIYVVLFKYPAGATWAGPSSSTGYRALQLFEGTSIPTYTPISKPLFLRGTIAISDSPSLSTILNTSINTQASTNAVNPLSNLPIPSQFGSAPAYFAFCFRPTGGTNLAIPTSTSSYPCLAVCDLKLSSPAQLPNNYAVLQINPINGTLETFRP